MIDDWVREEVHEPERMEKRWCPSHHRWEDNPPGRLLCGLAWRDQYELEREVKIEKMGADGVIIRLAESMDDLVMEIRTGVIVEPPPRPPAPPLPPSRPTRPTQSRTGKGGVLLP